jgi:FkbM family methyltransferase
VDYWLRWKRWWRDFERSPEYKLIKRRIRQLYGRELRHFSDLRVPLLRYGDWSFAPGALAPGVLVYSLGVGEDAELDRALMDGFGAQVHAFDPTPRAIAWVKRQRWPAAFHFYPVGLAGYDGTAEFVAARNPAEPSYHFNQPATASAQRIQCEVRRLTTLAQQLGHKRIDLLKIDIEGAEYDVLDDLLASDLVVPQLLVEFHHRFKHIGRERTARAVDALRAAGYRVIAISPSGQEYSFLRSI